MNQAAEPLIRNGSGQETLSPKDTKVLPLNLFPGSRLQPHGSPAEFTPSLCDGCLNFTIFFPPHPQTGPSLPQQIASLSVSASAPIC